MLAFKRALSLILIWMLAVPSSAWAVAPSSEAASAKRSSAKSKTLKKPLAKSTGSRAGRKAAPTWTEATWHPEGAASDILPLMTKGKQKYFEMGTVSSNGRMNSRILVGQELTEIMVRGREGSGGDMLEVSDGSLKLTFKTKLNGSFMKLLAEERVKNGVLSAEFLLASDHKSYRMTYAQLRPYSRVAAAKESAASAAPASPSSSSPTIENLLDGSANPVCQDQDPLEKLRSAMSCVQQLATDGAVETAMQCKIKRFQRFLFDPSCLTSPWTNEMPNITTALAQVMSSASKSAHAGASPKLLACLDGNGMGDSSTKIQADWMANFENIVVALQGGALNDAEINALLKDDGNCAPIEKVHSSARNRDYTPHELMRAPLIHPYICNDSNATANAEFDFRTRQILLHENGASLASQYHGNPVQGYATLFLHEHLHETGWTSDDHDLIDAAQVCCAPQDGDSNSGNCSNLRNLIHNDQANEQDEGAFDEALPGYLDAKTSILNDFGVNNGKAMLKQFFTNVRNNTAKVRASLHDRNEKCKSQPDPVQCRDQVQKEFLKAEAAASDMHWKNICPKYAGFGHPSTRATCTALGRKFHEMILGSGSAPTAVARKRSAQPAQPTNVSVSTMTPTPTAPTKQQPTASAPPVVLTAARPVPVEMAPADSKVTVVPVNTSDIVVQKQIPDVVLTNTIPNVVAAPPKPSLWESLTRPFVPVAVTPDKAPDTKKNEIVNPPAPQPVQVAEHGAENVTHENVVIVPPDKLTEVKPLTGDLVLPPTEQFKNVELQARPTAIAPSSGTEVASGESGRAQSQSGSRPAPAEVSRPSAPEVTRPSASTVSRPSAGGQTQQNTVSRPSAPEVSRPSAAASTSESSTSSSRSSYEVTQNDFKIADQSQSDPTAIPGQRSGNHATLLTNAASTAVSSVGTVFKGVKAAMSAALAPSVAQAATVASNSDSQPQPRQVANSGSRSSDEPTLSNTKADKSNSNSASKSFAAGSNFADRSSSSSVLSSATSRAPADNGWSSFGGDPQPSAPRKASASRAKAASDDDDQDATDPTPAGKSKKAKSRGVGGGGVSSSGDDGSGQQGSFDPPAFKNAVEVERFIMTADYKRVPEMVMSPRFKPIFEQRRIAIRLPSGERVGSRDAGATVLVACPQKARYVLDGACK